MNVGITEVKVQVLYVEINILLPCAIFSLLRVKTKTLGATPRMSVQPKQKCVCFIKTNTRGIF
jgi:hypothetical protein